ncbi:expressed unknown protein [Seminavis robusta]|uniref:Uncharacterized protein n=1 Tax=Seminavis robusta TaxID=568900 RepID=A0A9N8HG60_9STRA|nr:expressed unknown protein [Seminavis robusta]|eukprot:Sro614_g175690.1 n/a (1313) ;mRNA; r:10050-14406
MVGTPQHQGIQFERPVGAPADVSELEYICALHQTIPEEIRTDGTIHAKDIRNYLTSRHGVYVDPSVIEEQILQQLCGHYVPEDGKQTNEFGDVEPTVMDLCQMITLLLIPFLRREDISEAAKPTHSLNHGIVEQVLKLIMEELEIKGVDLQPFKAIDENFETGTKITKKLLQLMFQAYEEYDVPDDVLEEMVEQAVKAQERHQNGGDDDNSDNDNNSDQSEEVHLKTRKRGDGAPRVMLNKDSFLRALTYDVQLYDPEEMEASITTTHLQDAQNANRNNGSGDSDKSSMEDDFTTMAQVDQAADNYRSILWFVLLWVTLVLHYFCYVWDYPNGFVSFNSCKREFGCDVASAVVNWLIVLAQVGVPGFLYITLGSGGNATTHKGDELGSAKVATAFRVMIAMGVVTCATVIPNFVQGDVFIWNSIKADGWEPLHWFCFALGVVLLCLQFLRLIDVFAPLGSLGVGGKGRGEQALKEAATKKVNIVVENAMVLHVSPVQSGETLKSSEGWKYPARHTSPAVIQATWQWHKDHLEELKKNRRKKKHKYREGSNIESLTRGEGMARALEHYRDMEQANTCETVGGVAWAFQRIIDGRLFDEEGIWLSSRLITSNVAQVFVIAGVVIFYVALVAWFEETKANSIAVGQRRLEEGVSTNIDNLHALFRAEQQSHYHGRGQQRQRHRNALARQRHLMRRLQIVREYNSTHYTDGSGVYPNIIYDVNSTHFSDGTNFWAHTIYSHNGTHVFDKFFRYNSTHFTDGEIFYSYAQFATNGTHITNGEYLFDGVAIVPLNGNQIVARVQDGEFQAASSVGLAAAVVATVGIAVVFIPSFVSTVLKFRCGILTSLKGGEAFQYLRTSPNQVTWLLGSALWGAAYSGLLAGLFAGGLCFFLVWSETTTTAVALLALFFGFHAVLLIDFLVNRLFRDLYVSFFFRRHPAVVNLINVLTESWNLVVMMGLIWYRAVKLLGTTIYYIGRIDVPVFSPGVGYVGAIALDFEHFNFKRDLLIHEAHRHPYLERLGLMYLLKLYHNDFGSRAGAYWRLLFVLALMPWMSKWRVRSYEANGDSDSDDDESEDEDDDGEKGVKDDDSLMSLHGMELELDVTKRANEMLTRRNGDLKSAVEDLRIRLRDANKSIAKLERKQNRARSSNLGPGSTESPSKPGPAADSTESLPGPGPVSVGSASREADDTGHADSSESLPEPGPASVGSASREADDTDDADRFFSEEEEENDSFESGSGSGGNPGPVSVQLSDDDDDDFMSSDDEQQGLLKKNKGNNPKQSTDDDSFESEGFDDEFSSEEEDLAELIKKEKAKRGK